MDTLAIANALADRFAGVTATYDGVTESLASTPTGLLPNTVARGPVVLVFPFVDAELGIALRRRDDILPYTVRLLRDPVDVPSRTGWLYAWWDAMRDRVEAKMRLGLDYVAWAQPIGGRVEIDGFPYGLATFDVVELVVNVRLDEVVTTLGGT